MSPGEKHDGDCHFAASFLAAIVNFPLWRASAIAQSGFKLSGTSVIHRYYNAVIQPPFRGVTATMLGMTWARGFIFYASDSGKASMKAKGHSTLVSTTVPPMAASVFVQIVNMPLVRGTITIQNPSSPHETVRAALAHIYASKGVKGLWHGTSAGLMKSVPKYVTAVIIRDWCEDSLPQFGDPNDHNSKIARSAVKSSIAGIAGAALTNPLDVIRNE